MAKSKCNKCKKKTGMMEFKCDCNKIFCIKCRYPEEHNCDFNYNIKGKDELKKQLIKISNNKIELI
jgi:predicted nucleic acid binding AN1-type Zn finger protein